MGVADYTNKALASGGVIKTLAKEISLKPPAINLLTSEFYASTNSLHVCNVIDDNF